MEITGTIFSIGATQTIGEKGFKKRQLVVTTTENYPQNLPIEFTQDKCAVLDNYLEGQSVTVGINLRGSEYNGRHYLSAQGWKIQGV